MPSLIMDDFFAVVSYPQLNEKDHLWIDAFREVNDAFYELIPAHFSFVFPVFDVEQEDFVREVKKQAKGFQKFSYRIRCAIRNNDRTSEYWHVLLVPDEGFSHMVKLHDKLYSVLFKPLERLDLDFIPHLGIANSTDPSECKRMVDEVNAMDPDIRGTIDQLDIIQYKDKRVSTIEVLELTG